MDRKEFFGVAFKYFAGKGLDLVTNNPVIKKLEGLGNEDNPSHGEDWERPPGAAEYDAAFRRDCTGCDRCMIACPVNVIMVEDPDESRIPIIYTKEAPCQHCEGYPCIESCPSEALSLDRLPISQS